MEDKNFDKQYGIDPRQKSNLRSNGQNAPQSIDWDILMNAGLKGTKTDSLTPWGQAVKQNSDMKDLRNEKNSN